MKSNQTWIIVAILLILCATGVGIYAIYVKKRTKAGYVSDNVFDVMTSGFPWYAEDYAQATVQYGRNDKVAGTINGSGSGSAQSASMLNLI